MCVNCGRHSETSICIRCSTDQTVLMGMVVVKQKKGKRK